MATGVLDELRTLRRFDELALGLLIRLTREELRRFPVLAADSAFSEEDWAVEFFVAKGEAFLKDALLKATDDGELGRMLRVWLRHWLTDRNARTALGALRDRLEKRLDRDSRFRRAPLEHLWCLTQGPETPGSDDINALVVVAQRTFVTFYAESPNAQRRAQLGKAGELEVLLVNVLEAAGGALHISTLTGVLAQRFPHVLDPQTRPIPDEEWRVPAAIELTPEEEIVAAEDRQAIEAAAHRVLANLSEVELRLVDVINDPRAAASVLGVGRSTTALRIRTLKAKLIELAGDDDTSRLVLARVISMRQDSVKTDVKVSD